MATQAELEILIKAKDESSSVLKKIGGALGGLAAGAAVTGIAAIGTGIGFAASAGLGFNNAMEQATAKLNAFTKDGAMTAELLEKIRTEAAKTPFEFTEMSNALVALMPSAQQSGAAIMDLVSQAEILAASNPAQGLEGAAFAIKEAMGGDFTSAIERFNLSRTTINQLKAEGVPALQILGTAMTEMGMDADLVANMANTLSGRWSTFTDTFNTLAGTVTQPIFDTASAGLGNLNTWLETNQPTLQGYADTAAESIRTVIDIFGEFAGGNYDLAMQDVQRELMKLGFDPTQVEGISTSLNAIIGDAKRIAEAFTGMFTGASVDGATAFTGAMNEMAGALGKIAGYAEQVEAMVNMIKNSGLGQFGGQVLSAIQISPTELMQTGQSAMAMATGPAGLASGMAGRANADPELVKILGQITAAIQELKGGPPLQVNSTVEINGDAIGRSVNHTLGNQVAGYKSMGKPSSFQ